MTDLGDLARELRSVKVKSLAGPVIGKAGVVMAKKARDDAPTGPHLTKASGGRLYAQSITSRKDGALATEVFARGTGQGNLSAILEYGQGRNVPHPHIIPQLEPEADVAADWIARVVTDALR